jgi:hypothetical protein
MEEPEETRAIRNEKGQFVPDASGNPDGKRLVPFQSFHRFDRQRGFSSQVGL